jgi:nucleoside-triphosphatase
MLNIFLTGDVGIGKSTVLNKTLALLPPMVCGGFRTVSRTPITRGAQYDVFIESTRGNTPRDAAHLVGTRWGDGRNTSYPEAFDTAGAVIVTALPAAAELIIMDELGFMESDAEVFRRAVMNALDGALPVLGVIKPRRSDFLDGIRAHPRSQIFEVTAENRDALYIRVAQMLSDVLPKAARG